MDRESVQTVEAPRQAELPTRDQVRQWLVDAIAELLGMPPGDIDTRQTYARYGLDSSAAIGMTDNLGSWIGVELDATLFYDYPTIEALCEHLVRLGVIRA